MGLTGLVVPIGPAQALQPPARAQEIATCLPGEQTTWGDGRDRPALQRPLVLVYRHAGAPPWFSDVLVRSRVQQAALAWAACGVEVVVLPDDASGAATPPSGAVQVLWDESGSAGAFGLAHLGQRRLSLGRGAFQLLRERNPGHPAQDVLQMVLSHELGHFFGLMSHSRRCVDVMSYYTDGKGGQCTTRDGADHRRVPEYRALLPTACDIARCRALNATGP